MLSEKHRNELNSSIPQNEIGQKIISLNFWTIDGNTDDVEKLLWPDKPKDKKFNHPYSVPGWVARGIVPTGSKQGEFDPESTQYKPDNPRKSHDGKIIKYESVRASDASIERATPLFLDHPDDNFWPSIQESRGRLWITEGAKKAACLMALGEGAISIPGVYNGQLKGRLKRSLQSFLKPGMTVVLAFDSDWLQKFNVREAMKRMGRLLIKDGINVEIATWNEQHKGIDDYLMATLDVDGCRSSEELLQGIKDGTFTYEEWIDNIKGLDKQQGSGGSKLASQIRRFRELLGDRLKLNEMTCFYEFDGEKVNADELRIILAMDLDVDCPRDFETIMLAVAQKYHPVREYLDSCYSEYGSSVDPDAIFKNFAERYFGCSEPVYQLIMRKWFIGTTERVFKPGCQRDEVLVLQGKQGYRKSSFFRVISNGFFDDSVGAFSDKDEKLKLHRSWIIEWAEIEAIFRKKDISVVKSQITAVADLLRPPYGKQIVEMKRFSSIVGTTNEDQFLSDPTGHRRYQVIPVLKKIDTEQLELERDQIWAAAVALHMRGEKGFINDKMQEQVNALSSQYETSHPWETAVLEYARNWESVTVREILETVIQKELKEMTRGDEMAVADILRRAGWEQGKRQTVNGIRVRPWLRPALTEAEAETEAETEVKVGENPSTKSDQPEESDDQPPSTRAVKIGDTVTLMDGRSAVVEFIEKDIVNNGSIFHVKNGKPTPECIAASEILWPPGSTAVSRSRNEAAVIVQFDQGMYQIQSESFLGWVPPSDLMEVCFVPQ